MHHRVFIHSPGDGHVSHCQLIVVRNKTMMNIHIQSFTWVYVFISLGKIPRSEIAGLYNKHLFNFIGNWFLNKLKL